MSFTIQQPYAKRQLTDPSDQTISYPALKVTFARGKSRITVGNALVDTGADETVLPLALAVELGFEFDLEKDKEIWHGAGNKEFIVYRSPEPIEFILETKGFKPMKWKAKVAFALEQPTVLIGRRGFLDKFHMEFRGPEQILKLTAV